MFKEKERANELLRYLILISKGYGFKAPLRIRFAVLLSLKEDLERLSAKWQVERAKNWINLFLRREGKNLQSKTDTRKGGIQYGKTP
jgi:hypothetical protein